MGLGEPCALGAFILAQPPCALYSAPLPELPGQTPPTQTPTTLLTCRSTSRSTPPLPRDSGCGSASAGFLCFPPEGRVGEGEEGDAEFKPGLEVPRPKAPFSMSQGWEPCYKGDHKRGKGLTLDPWGCSACGSSRDLALRGTNALVLGSALGRHL